MAISLLKRPFSALSGNTPKCHPLTMRKTFIHQIISGEKTVEGRIFERSVCNVKVGDTVRFYYYSNSADCVTCQVTSLEHFSSFSELVNGVGYEKCIPSAKNIEEAISAYDAIKGYTEKAKKYGVVAFHIRPIIPGFAIYFSYLKSSNFLGDYFIYESKGNLMVQSSFLPEMLGLVKKINTLKEQILSDPIIQNVMKEYAEGSQFEHLGFLFDLQGRLMRKDSLRTKQFNFG